MSPVAQDQVIEENWAIRWFLWHSFRYRDNRKDENRGPRAGQAYGSEYSFMLLAHLVLGKQKFCLKRKFINVVKVHQTVITILPVLNGWLIPDQGCSMTLPSVGLCWHE
jgi:hypothetical protein